MKTLPFDVSRCAGRYGFDPDGEWCPERNACQRYLAFTQWDRESDIPDYVETPVCMGMTDCQIKIEAVEVTE